MPSFELISNFSQFAGCFSKQGIFSAFQDAQNSIVDKIPHFNRRRRILKYGIILLYCSAEMALWLEKYLVFLQIIYSHEEISLFNLFALWIMRYHMTIQTCKKRSAPKSGKFHDVSTRIKMNSRRYTIYILRCDNKRRVCFISHRFYGRAQFSWLMKCSNEKPQKNEQIERIQRFVLVQKHFWAVFFRNLFSIVHNAQSEIEQWIPCSLFRLTNSYFIGGIKVGINRYCGLLNHENRIYREWNENIPCRQVHDVLVWTII